MDGSSASITVDGNGHLAGTFANSLLTVGALNSGASHFFDGKLSEIAIWTSALSSGQMNDYTACGDPSAIAEGPLSVGR